MKRYALLTVTAVALIMVAPAISFSQGNFGGPPGGGNGGPGAGGPPQGQQNPQAEADRKAEQELELKNRKSEMLLKISHHMAELEKAKTCVEGATTHEALRSCMPRGGGPGGGMQGGPGGGMQGGPGGGMMGGPGGGMQGGPGGGMMGGPGGPRGQ